MRFRVTATMNEAGSRWNGATRAAVSDGEKALSEAGTGTTERQIHFLLARAYAKLGKKDVAAAHRRLFEQLPDDFTAMMLLLAAQSLYVGNNACAPCHAELFRNTV